MPWREVPEVFRPFANDPVAALLDSAATGALACADHENTQAAARSRYSYIAVEPYTVIVADGSGVRVDGEAVVGDPFTVLQQRLAACRIADTVAPVPFAGGAVGYLAYEMGRHADRFPPLIDDPHGVPEMVIGLYDCVIAFDHARQESFLISTGLPETNAPARERRAREREAHILERLQAVHPLPPSTGNRADDGVRIERAGRKKAPSSALSTTSTPATSFRPILPSAGSRTDRPGSTISPSTVGCGPTAPLPLPLIWPAARTRA